MSTANPHEQAPMVEEFLNGLVASFGLDGQVNVSVEDEVSWRPSRASRRRPW